jgi:3-hydroxy acid dehydrogenase/malonic semialdehyde reductase
VSTSSSFPKVVFVTGASAGFGAAVARTFAARGAKVIAAARREDRLLALQAELGAGTLFPVTLDVTSHTSITHALSVLPEPFRAIDCLVNSAGLALGLEGAAKAKLEDWDTMINTNCAGLVAVTRAILPGMIERKRGHIVNLGSIAGTYPYPGGNVYGATKAFVHQFSLNLRSDLHGSGLRVTCIEPGMCGGTEFSEVRFGGDKAKAAAVYAGMTPLSSEDIAESVAWATSQPAHVNVNVIELMPVAQSFAPFQIDRTQTSV